MSKTKNEWLKLKDLRDDLQYDLESVEGELMELRMRERYLKSEIEKLNIQIDDEE